MLMEDGLETMNIITGNLGANTRPVQRAFHGHDARDVLVRSELPLVPVVAGVEIGDDDAAARLLAGSGE